MNAIIKANEFIVSHQAQVKKKNYPGFHLAAPTGWINDPNGFCYALGQYHIFYQHYPYDAQWGPMHWGHAVSTDLVNWTHLPVALAPSEPYDKDGCFSGSAIEYEGKLYLIYTGHVWLKELGNDDAIREVQCLAVSEDGIHFKKAGVIIEPPHGIMHFRDPKVWREDDHFALVLGARFPGDQAKILKYVSADLKTWTFKGAILTAPQGEAFMYECPDVFPLNGKYAAVLSPMGLKPHGIARNNPSITSYVIADDGENFDPNLLTEIDHGHDFYASQSMQSPDGRRLMIAWLAMWKLPFASYPDGWCGMLTLPRELSLKDGKLVQRPVRELSAFYKKEKILGQIELTNSTCTLKKHFKPARISFILKGGQEFECAGIHIDEALSLYVDRQHGELTLLRKEPNAFSSRSIPLDLKQDLTLEIYLDASSIEVFVNGGVDTFTSAFYSGKRQHISLFVHNEQAVFDAVKVITLKSVMRHKQLLL